MSGKTHRDRKTVLHKHFQTTDAAMGNDIRLAVVAVTSRTSAKWQEYSKVPRVFDGLFAHIEYSGSDFNYSSAFQRGNYLVRTKTGN